MAKGKKSEIEVGHHYVAVSVTIVLFFAIASVLGVFGLLPKDIQEVVQPAPLEIVGSSTSQTADSRGAGQSNPPALSSRAESRDETPVQYDRGMMKEAPLRVVIAKVSVDAKVKNPTSTSPIVLDAALKEGAVRYPSSGLLGEQKNVFLFGHSAYSRVIKNSSYHTFDGIEKLVAGDEIRVDGTEYSYFYKVARVSFLKDVDAYIDLDSNIRMLTLSTCNAFGAKDDRVVVQAAFVKQMKVN